MTQVEIVDNNVEEKVNEVNFREKYILLKVSNSALKHIQRKIHDDKGDPDDPKYIKLDKEVKKDIHEVWKILNPS